MLAGCTVETAAIDQADTACADGQTVMGMDVSYYETSVDWAMAKQAGIEFAFIRATDGTQYIDPKFPMYWAGAKAAGVIRGAYQFFRPAEDPIAQADLLLQQIGTIEPGDLPPVIDVEVNGGLSTAGVAAAVQAWADHIAAAIGRPPIVYAGLYSWHDLTASYDITTSPLWVAQYTSAACPDIPLPWTRWAFWQDTSTGSITGVPGSTLDLDVFNGTHDDLVAFANGTQPPPCGTIAADGDMIDDGDACFVGGGPAAYMRDVTGAGEDGDLEWTHATNAATEANFGQWNLDFAEGGRYLVEAYTAHAYAQSQHAHYQITAAGQTTTVDLDQSAVDGWQSLGELDFAAGGDQLIHLGDNTGEAPSANIQIVFDAIRFTRIDGAPPPPPPPQMHEGGGCAAGGTPSLLLALLVLTCRGRRPPTSRRGSTAPRR